MTNSEDEQKVAKIIDEVFGLTCEEYLQLRIDEPIEKAAGNFVFDRTSPVTHESFNQVIGAFVTHVFENWRQIRISATEARIHAVSMLEEGYEASHGRGYHAAYLDACNPRFDGLEFVLVQMSRYMTVSERAKHIKWVCATRIDPTDWPKKCLIAEVLLKSWGPFLPPNIRACPPAQVANHIFDLIQLVLSTNRSVAKMLGVNTVLG